MRIYLDDQSQIRISLEAQAKQEPFDYTAWQKEHYAEISVHDLNQKAVEYTKLRLFKPAGETAEAK
jgi:hypothetical protein